MLKNINKLHNRRQFVKELIDKPDNTIERLEMLIISLKNSRHSDERFKIAADLLFLSDQTIFNDYLS